MKKSLPSSAAIAMVPLDRCVGHVTDWHEGVVDGDYFPIGNRRRGSDHDPRDLGDIPQNQATTGFPCVQPPSLCRVRMLLVTGNQNFHVCFLEEKPGDPSTSVMSPLLDEPRQKVLFRMALT